VNIPKCYVYVTMSSYHKYHLMYQNTVLQTDDMI